jgi:nuclear cap-binding protein subunit 1
MYFFFNCPFKLVQVRRDWYVYAFLSSLPWVGKELYEKKDAEMDRIFSTTESYLK